MTQYLSDDDLVVIVERYDLIVADPGLFFAAIVRPAMSVFGVDAYPTIWLKAAAHLESLARNHALADGNKRTAMRVTALFLRLNGWNWTAHPENENFVVSVATGETSLEASAAFLEAHSEPLTDP